MLTGTTTDATPTSLFVNGDPNTTIIARDISTYIGYKFEIVAVRTGGTHAGSIGDRTFLELNGINDRTVSDEHIETINKTGTGFRLDSSNRFNRWQYDIASNR